MPGKFYTPPDLADSPPYLHVDTSLGRILWSGPSFGVVYLHTRVSELPVEVRYSLSFPESPYNPFRQGQLTITSAQPLRLVRTRPGEYTDVWMTSLTHDCWMYATSAVWPSLRDDVVSPSPEILA
jgi:hypothetical protein